MSNGVKDFILSDHNYVLFPLNTSKLLATHQTDKIIDHINSKILNKSDDEGFGNQLKVNASKPNFHLRRTFKLDPVAETFLYNFVYQNRSRFKKRDRPRKRTFGYYFTQGSVVSSLSEYRDFRNLIYESISRYDHCIKFDIQSYFNSIYHHDIVNFINCHLGDHDKSESIGQFLREINSGISIDCMPQGIIPAKIIGSKFLSFIDDSVQIKADITIRFMDDFYIFGNDEKSLLSDFILIQEMLGRKGLNINQSKTQINYRGSKDIVRDIDEMKITLLERRDLILEDTSMDEEEQYDFKADLDEEEVEYLTDLLDDPHLAEEDAELILKLMGDHTSDVIEHLHDFAEKFPNLSKNIHAFCSYVEDKSSLSDVVYELTDSSVFLTEYQLFWIAKIVEDYLLETPKAGDLIFRLYEHENSTTITKAKICEIPENRFGMEDVREEHLRSGSSDWLSWTSAVGAIATPKSKRNQLVKYLASGPFKAHIVADMVTKFD